MNKLITLTAAGLLLTAPGAFAAPEHTGMESSPASQTALQASQTWQSETQDGNKVEVAPDGTVSVYKDESKMTPPDGTLTLKDGSTLTVKDGKKV